MCTAEKGARLLATFGLDAASAGPGRAVESIKVITTNRDMALMANGLLSAEKPGKCWVIS